MASECPKNTCYSHRVVRFGAFVRKSDSKKIQRWKCKSCGSTFSAATKNPCFGQNKRRLNPVILAKILGKTSQRRTALLLKINRKTVARKIRFLALKASLSRQKFLLSYKKKKALNLQFDDMVTFEHTKCKPVAISLLVEEGSRKILDFEVSPMTANGQIAALSRKKYGKRKDGRKQAWNRLLARSKDFIDERAHFKSDQHPLYPRLIKDHFPNSSHERFKGRKGCVVGQGELKSGGFDPLFSLNHSCAMIRDGLARLVRRTWCTTKKLEALRLQLEIYVDFHNRVLTR